ncbi:MAG: hypothetical protein Q4C48_06855 [Lachnospiraceae bacterium]|nr:hypothetical protein [Lachnospiraceae bacterium]
MKKSIRNALVFTLTFLLIVGLGIFGMFAAFFYTSKWKYAVDFKENEDEFNCVKDYVLQYYEGAIEEYISIEHKDGKCNLQYSFNTPEAVSEALECVVEAFDPDASLELIRFGENRLTFDTMCGYALVWSPDEKPTWLFSPDEDREISVKKAGDGWYHIVEQ